MIVCARCGQGPVDGTWACAACGHVPATIDGFLSFAPDSARGEVGFHADYFGALAELEAGSFWFRARNDLIAWALARYAPRAADVLEIGCGTGYVLARIRATLPAAELSGSEILSAGLPFARERVPSATFYQMDARRIPFREAFDVVGAFDVIEHIDDDVAVIEEVGRALRPGGTLLLTVPQHPALWSAQDDHAYHVRRYTASALRRKVEGAGFEIVRMTSFVSLLLPMLVGSRLRLRARPPGDGFDAIDAVRLPHALNVVLEKVMAVERAVIRAGASFPAGGSLLVVARRRDRAGAAA